MTYLFVLWAPTIGTRIIDTLHYEEKYKAFQIPSISQSIVRQPPVAREYMVSSEIRNGLEPSIDI